ncbi:hypothetical protein MBLNU230_g5827t1 [Neophaeotheca triangularis]
MPNGDHASNDNPTTQSAFLNKLTSYPVVNDSIQTYKTNPYGAKSLDLTQNIYNRFAAPLKPHLQTPLSYAQPYAQRADNLGVSGLETLESHAPIVKEDTGSLVDRAKGLVWFPFRKTGEAKDYVMSTWQSEYEKTARYKNRGPGVTTSVMAIVSTELKVASDFFSAVADWLGPKYEEGKENASEIVDKAQKKGEQYVKAGQQTAEEWKQVGQDKAAEYQKYGREKKEEAKQEADGAAKEAEKKGDEVQGEVKKRTNANK